MRLLLLPLTLLSVPYSTLVYADTGCEAGSLHPDAPAATRQFEFLLGNHDVTLHAWTGSGWTPPRPTNAHWRGWYGQDGMVIYDEWIDPDPNSGGRGTNVRLFDPVAGVWKMMWVSTAGYQVQDLRAEVREGALTMWQAYPERPGWKAVFEQIDERRWARTSYQQDEAGTWQPQFRLEATRQPCS